MNARPRPNSVRLLRLIAIAALLALLICTYIVTRPKLSRKPGTMTSSSTTLPCDGAPVSVAELGSPYRTGPTAEFTTTGGVLFVTARRFEHGGVFDPERGVTAIYIGPAAKPPTWDQERNVVSNVSKTITVQEKEYSQLNLPPGRYWLWTSTGGDIQVSSCQSGGVTDPLPR
jgi:hypothetical protein